MTLKNETERLENSSNKIKTIKTNINKELVAKGSTNANTLADIPNLINKLNLENVKFATGNANIQIKGGNGTLKRINTNLDFLPKQVLLKVTTGDKKLFVWADLTLNETNFTMNSIKLTIYQIEILDNQINFWRKTNNKDPANLLFRVVEWIAIG